MNPADLYLAATILATACSAFGAITLAEAVLTWLEEKE